MDIEPLVKQNQTEPTISDPLYVTFYGFLFFALSIFIWRCVMHFRQKRNSVLFLGLPNSGKTLLFAHMIFRQYRETISSKRENIGEYVTAQMKTLKIIDIPGRVGLRYKYFDQYKHCAVAIVFVIDSSTIVTDIKDVAEYMYMVLLDPAIRKHAIPVLILCNKQDLPTASSLDFIKDLLENEMQMVRITKINQLGVAEPSQSTSTVYLGKQYEKFRFCQLGCRLDIAQSSGVTGNEDESSELLALRLWIDIY